MTLKELEEKEVELRSAIDTADSPEKLADIESGLDKLQEQRKNYYETKNKMEERFKNMDNTQNLINLEERKEDTFKSEEERKRLVRRAFAKNVLFESTKRNDAKLTNAEIRALAVSNTTTSSTFVEAAENADGVNNGGLFIPQEVILEILEEEAIESPIFNDIITTSIKGMTKFPYKFSKTGAKKKAELTATDNENVEWKVLSGSTGNYTDSIVLTFEAEAMAINEFADYLIRLIGESMRELLINDYIYGDGNSDSVKGLTVGAIDGKYATADKAKYRKIIEDAIKLLPAKKRAGAKIYVASDIYDGMTFEKDTNGNYILPVLNGGGLTKISVFPIVADANLSAGDFIIGNLAKWYKANINKQMELGLDVSNQKRTKTYTTHMMVTAIPVPNSFVYGTENN